MNKRAREFSVDWLLASGAILLVWFVLAMLTGNWKVPSASVASGILNISIELPSLWTLVISAIIAVLSALGRDGERYGNKPEATTEG